MFLLTSTKEWLKDETADEDEYDEKIKHQQTEEQRVMEESSAALAGVVGMSPKQRYLCFEDP